jgi:Gram-negative bacterial TonB protein C-terminal
MNSRSVQLLFFCWFLSCLPAQAQDTTYYDQRYEPTNLRGMAHYMEIRKCAVDNQNKCSVSVFSLDSNRILRNFRYSDYKKCIPHGRCSRWYLSGGLHDEITFNEGKKQGLEKCYYPNGQLKKELLWAQDSLIKGAFFNLDGSSKTTVFKEDLDEYEDESDPSFPGGIYEMYLYLNDKAHYQKPSKVIDWPGEVVLSVVIGKDGSIIDAQVLRAPNLCLFDPVEEVAKGMPRWEPGRSSGIPVRSRFTFSFMFKLK